MMVANVKPIFQANFFCRAPTYSGFCRLTIKRASIKVGENLGLMNIRMIKSARNIVMKYFRTEKSCLKLTSMIA